MGRITNSIELFKASWAVIRQDRELLALPVVSAIAALGTIALFAYPIYTTVNLDAVAADGSSTVEASPLTFVLVALAYLILAFVGIFFNAALVHATNERMSGGDPTLSSALSGASGRVNRILPWAIVSATVSFIIRQIQERGGLLGGLLGFLGGVAWSAVTFLVLPILVIENISVTEAVKRSGGLLRNAWGEGLAGHIGLGIIGFIAVIPFLLIGALGFVAGSTIVLIPTVTIAVLGLVAVAIVMSALSVVYQTALYRYATAQPTVAYSQDLMQSAFVQKRSRR